MNGNLMEIYCQIETSMCFNEIPEKKNIILIQLRFRQFMIPTYSLAVCLFISFEHKNLALNCLFIFKLDLEVALNSKRKLKRQFFANFVHDFIVLLHHHLSPV